MSRKHGAARNRQQNRRNRDRKHHTPRPELPDYKPCPDFVQPRDESGSDFDANTLGPNTLPQDLFEPSWLKERREAYLNSFRAE